MTPDDERLEPLRAACGETDAVALVGAPISDASGGTYIATLAVSRSEVFVAYRKINLHLPEPDSFDAGESASAVEVRGWRLGLAICRDTGVPSHVSDTVGLGIDAYVAGALFTTGEARERDRRMADIARTHDVWVLLSAFAGDNARPDLGWLRGVGTWRATRGPASSEPGDCALAVVSS